MLKYDDLSRVLLECGLHPDPSLFEELVEKYAEPTRHYHTDQHIIECLRHFNTHRSLAVHPAQIELAIWFHDAIYNPLNSDNEEKSASWAKRYLKSHGAGDTIATSVSEIILATKHHEASNEDESLMLDIDLGILGGSEHAFARYDAAIRREYHWVPEQEYRTKRIEVLETFLSRKVIYQTKVFREQYETQARNNLTRKIKELRA